MTRLRLFAVRTSTDRTSNGKTSVLIRGSRGRVSGTLHSSSSAKLRESGALGVILPSSRAHKGFEQNRLAQPPGLARLASRLGSAVSFLGTESFGRPAAERTSSLPRAAAPGAAPAVSHREREEGLSPVAVS